MACCEVEQSRTQSPRDLIQVETCGPVPSANPTDRSWILKDGEGENLQATALEGAGAQGTEAHLSPQSPECRGLAGPGGDKDGKDLLLPPLRDSIGY